MITATLYICEKCGKQSRKHDVIELCEAKHLGLNKRQKHEYDRLCEDMDYKIAMSPGYPKMDEQADIAIRKVLEFEKLHGIK